MLELKNCSYKSPQENIGENLLDIGLGNVFFDTTPVTKL